MAFVDTHALAVKAPLPGWRGRFFDSEHLTFGCYDVEPGASIHEHEHPNEEIWYIIEGRLEFTIGNETRIAGPGEAALVPGHTRHRVTALTDARVIVVDHPRRTAIGNVRLT
jgi:quercetin dioxygenase-like cupin family protein